MNLISSLILKWIFARINWSIGDVLWINLKNPQATEIRTQHFHVPGTESNSKHPIIPWICIHKSSCYHLQETSISLKVIKTIFPSYRWDWEGAIKRKIKSSFTFLAAFQFSSLIAMGAPRRTTLSTSSAANKQKKHVKINNWYHFITHHQS